MFFNCETKFHVRNWYIIELIFTVVASIIGVILVTTFLLHQNALIFTLSAIDTLSMVCQAGPRNLLDIRGVQQEQKQ